MINEITRSCKIFQNAPTETVDKLLSKGTVRPVDRGASIFLQGESAHSFFVVLEGWVKLYRMSQCGAETVTAVLTRSNCFGLASGLANSSYPTGAECASNATLLQVDARHLRHSIEADIQMSRAFLAASMEENRSLVRQVEQLKSSTGAQRIAAFLLELCDRKHDDCTVVLPFEKVLIAGSVGMKPESLSRAFRRLARVGVTISGDRAAIKSVQRLKNFLDEDPAESWARAAG